MSVENCKKVKVRRAKVGRVDVDIPKESFLHASQFEGSPLQTASRGSIDQILSAILPSRFNRNGTAAGDNVVVVTFVVVDRGGEGYLLPMPRLVVVSGDIEVALHAQKSPEVHNPQPSRLSNSGEGMGKVGLLSSISSWELSTTRHRHSSVL